MTVPEAAKQLNLSDQTLRLWIQHGCPFGVIVREGDRKSYYVSEERMKLWKEGKL